MSEKLPTGTIIKVRVNGKEYDTVIDENGTQRFIKNNLIRHLTDSKAVDLNKLCLDYQRGKFLEQEYAEFNMGLGYSVSGFCEISSFEDGTILNPLWGPEEQRIGGEVTDEDEE